MPDNKVRLSDYGLQSERLLWPRNGPAGRGPSVFEDEVAALERRLGLTTFGKLWAWVQTHSMWPDLFGRSCCTIEMMAVVGARYGIARFGMEFFRPRPALFMVEALTNDDLIQEAPAIVGCQTPSALRVAAGIER